MEFEIACIHLLYIDCAIDYLLVGSNSPFIDPRRELAMFPSPDSPWNRISVPRMCG